MDFRVAIIGAGISGLGAGNRLMEAGFKPVIFEKESFVGGRMSSEEVDGFIIDKAAYTFPEFHRNLTDLLVERRRERALVRTPGTSSTFKGGRYHPFKIGSPKDFLKYKALSPKNKKEMVKLFLYAQSLGKASSLVNPSRRSFQLEKESAAAYLQKHYNEEILDTVAYPIFCEIFLGIPENNSKLAFLATLRNLMVFKIFSFVHGMGMLPEELMKVLDVRLSSPVLEIRQVSPGGPYNVEAGGDHPDSLTFDAIIFAVPFPLVVDLFAALPVSLKQYAQAVRYAPSIVTAFALDKRYADTAMINNVLRRDFNVIGTVIVDHHKGPERVPEGKGLVTAILCEEASRGLFRESDDALAHEVVKEMDRLFIGFSDRVLFSRIYRWEFGAVQLPPGALYRQHLARKAVEDECDNLYFASDGLYKSSLEVSFNTGVRAANQIIAKASLSLS